MAAGKEKNGNETDSGPDVSVLKHGQNVWRSDREDGYDTKQQCDSRTNSHVVDRAYDTRLRAFWEMTVYPGIELICSNWTVQHCQNESIAVTAILLTQ